MKVLAIDCGNSRIKAALLGAGPGAPEIALELESLSSADGQWQAFLARCAQAERIVVANVAGAAIAQRLAESLRRFAAEPRWVRARELQCGVTNRYDDPAQLGADRWAALIGAWALERDACLVVNAGTATTIDALSARGEFLGGVILPGLALMRAALAQGTAALPLATGSPAAFPRNTGDAIWNGCILAQAGAIERMWRQLPESATCLLSGGAAGELYPALNMPCLVVDNLVLQGLLLIAQEE
jgi:type III pantothenate kinase